MTILKGSAEGRDRPQSPRVRVQGEPALLWGGFFLCSEGSPRTLALCPPRSRFRHRPPQREGKKPDIFALANGKLSGFSPALGEIGTPTYRGLGVRVQGEPALLWRRGQGEGIGGELVGLWGKRLLEPAKWAGHLGRRWQVSKHTSSPRRSGPFTDSAEAGRL